MLRLVFCSKKHQDYLIKWSKLKKRIVLLIIVYILLVFFQNIENDILIALLLSLFAGVLFTSIFYFVDKHLFYKRIRWRDLIINVDDSSISRDLNFKINFKNVGEVIQTKTGLMIYKKGMYGLMNESEVNKKKNHIFIPELLDKYEEALKLLKEKRVIP